MVVIEKEGRAYVNSKMKAVLPSILEFKRGEELEEEFPTLDSVRNYIRRHYVSSGMVIAENSESAQILYSEGFASGGGRILVSPAFVALVYTTGENFVVEAKSEMLCEFSALLPTNVSSSIYSNCTGRLPDAFGFVDDAVVYYYEQDSYLDSVYEVWTSRGLEYCYGLRGGKLGCDPIPTNRLGAFASILATQRDGFENYALNSDEGLQGSNVSLERFIDKLRRGSSVETSEIVIRIFERPEPESYTLIIPTYPYARATASNGQSENSDGDRVHDVLVLYYQDEVIGSNARETINYLSGRGSFVMNNAFKKPDNAMIELFNVKYQSKLTQVTSDALESANTTAYGLLNQIHKFVETHKVHWSEGSDENVDVFEFDLPCPAVWIRAKNLAQLAESARDFFKLGHNFLKESSPAPVSPSSSEFAPSIVFDEERALEYLNLMQESTDQFSAVIHEQNVQITDGGLSLSDNDFDLDSFKNGRIGSNGAIHSSYGCGHDRSVFWPDHDPFRAFNPQTKQTFEAEIRSSPRLDSSGEWTSGGGLNAVMSKPKVSIGSTFQYSIDLTMLPVLTMDQELVPASLAEWLRRSLEVEYERAIAHLGDTGLFDFSMDESNQTTDPAKHVKVSFLGFRPLDDSLQIRTLAGLMESPAPTGLLRRVKAFCKKSWHNCLKPVYPMVFRVYLRLPTKLNRYVSVGDEFTLDYSQQISVKMAAWSLNYFMAALGDAEVVREMGVLNGRTSSLGVASAYGVPSSVSKLSEVINKLDSVETEDPELIQLFARWRNISVDTPMNSKPSWWSRAVPATKYSDSRALGLQLEIL